MTETLILILLLTAQAGRVVGTVTDGLTNVPVHGAHVTRGKVGIVTNDAGSFVLDPVPAGECRLVASHVGFEPETVSVLVTPGQISIVNFTLMPRSIELPEVSVEAERPGMEEVVTTRVLTREDLRDRAGGFVQDPVRSLSFLPGVSHSSRGEWSGAYVVRGGDPDESKVWFGNVELLWPFHLLGFSSVINPDLVERMEFYPTVFPVRYGGALSSVTAIRPRRSRKGEGAFAYDPMNMKASYVGTMDDVEFMASVRRTFYYVQFGPIGSGRDNRPTYSDVTAQLCVPLGAGHRVRATVVRGSDNIRTNLRGVESEMSESGTALAATIESRFGPVESEVTCFYNTHDFRFAPTAWWGQGGTGQTETGVRVNLAGSVDDRLDLSGGFEGGRTEFDGNLQDRVGFGRSDMIRAAHVSARVRPGARTALDLGLRYEDVRWVSDVVLEPRAVLSVRPGAGTVFKAGYRRVHQHPYSFLRRSGASIVFDNEYDGYEMFRDGDLGAKRVDHYSVSGEFEPGAAIAVSAEAYLKRYSSLGTWLADSEGVRIGYGNDGHGSARGFEFVLEHRARAGWSGQATYGLAWCRKQEGTDTMPYWDEYDRRHSVNLSVMKEWPGDWRLTTTLHLHTGSPYTPLIYTRSRRELGGSDLNHGGFGWVIEGEKNSLRVPTYHRLDLKLQKELSHMPLKPFFYIEVLNLYNRQNVYHLVQFENRDGEIRTGRFTGIQFIPLIGMGGRF